jgi:polyisoprenoid-binding protein YceI
MDMTIVRRLGPVSLAVALIATVARADEQKPFVIDGGGSEVVYHLVHKLHHVDGHTRRVEGRAAVLADGRAQVELRVPVATFDSGNVNRDAHMKEVLEAGRFPTLEVKAIGSGLKLPPAGPATQTLPAKAQIDLHGIKQLVDIKVELSFNGDGTVKAATRFPISLDSFKIERPSLMFVKVDDIVQIDANLVFKPGT